MSASRGDFTGARENELSLRPTFILQPPLKELAALAYIENGR